MAKSDKFANSGYSVVEQTKAAIRIIRGQGVILAADVARIYGVTTKRRNRSTGYKAFGRGGKSASSGLVPPFYDQ